MCQLCVHRHMKHLGNLRALTKLELLSITTLETLKHVSGSPILPRASYLNKRTLAHEPIVKCIQFNLSYTLGLWLFKHRINALVHVEIIKPLCARMFISLCHFLYVFMRVFFWFQCSGNTLRSKFNSPPLESKAGSGWNCVFWRELTKGLLPLFTEKKSEKARI